MNKGYISILYYVLSFFISSFLISIFSLILNNYNSTPIYDYMYSIVGNCSNLIVYIIIFTGLIIINKDILDEFKFNKLSIFKMIFGVIFIFLLSLISNLLFKGVSNNQQNINILYKHKFILIIHACLLAPLVEEIVFRKSVRSLIKNPVIFVITSSLFFGLFHCLTGDFQNIIKYAIPGMGFAILYLIDNKTSSNYIIHLLYNLIIILLA